MDGKPVIDRPVLLALIDRGWTLVPLKGKRPKYGVGWADVPPGAPSREQVESWLDDGATGLGLHHGASGTADADLDCPEASALGTHLLPPTRCWWSRPLPGGGVKSHYVYSCADARHIAGNKIAELLTGRHQSVLPGSWHEETGDPICWGEDGDPAEVDALELEAALLTVKVGVVLGRRLEQGRGERHEIFLCVVGALAQAGWGLERVEQLAAAWVATGALDFVPNGLGTTFERHADARAVTQWGSMRRYLPPDDARLVQAWAYRVGGRAAVLDGAGEDGRAVVDLSGRAHLGLDVEAVRVELAQAGGVWVGPAGLSAVVGGEIHPHTLDSLRLAVSERIHFRRQGDKGVKSVQPPRELLAALLDSHEWSGLHVLERVCSVPVLRPDGSVAAEPGYDAPTRSWLTQAVGSCPVVGSTREEALAALELLRELVSESPFADELARDGWVAGVLTECAGAALARQPIPAWWVEANSQGAGKSTLAALALAIGHGTRPSPIVATERGKIDEKVLGSAVLSGASLWIDNLVGRLDDPTLAALVTSGSANVRRFHTQQIVEGRLDGRAVWITTNGGTFGADWPRRVVPVQLVVWSGKATDKRFAVRDVLGLALRHRSELYCAALTVLRAWLLARGESAPDHRWFGFEAWADLVLGALRWLGAGDLSRLQHEVAAEYDDETAGTERLLLALEAYLEAEGVDDLVARDLADDASGPTKVERQKPRENLRNIIRELSGVRSGDSLRAATVARVFRSHGRPVEGKRIVHTRTVRGDRFWGVWGGAQAIGVAQGGVKSRERHPDKMQ